MAYVISQIRVLFTSHNSSSTCILLIFFTSLILSPCIVQGSLTPQAILAKESVGTTTTEFVPYDGSKYGMAIQYPKNWNITADSEGVWFVSPVDRTGNIRISSQSSLNASLPELVQAQLLQAEKSYHSFKVNSSIMTTMAGNPANRTDYQIKDIVPKFLGSDTYEYGVIQISTIKGNKLYTFTYFSTPQNFHLFLPVAEKMLSTLKII